MVQLPMETPLSLERLVDQRVTKANVYSNASNQLESAYY